MALGLNSAFKSLRTLAVFALALAAFVGGLELVYANTGVTYQGRIIKPNGAPLQGTTVQFRMQIRTPGSQNCLMYEEQQQLNMSGSDGKFSLTINDGNGVRNDSTGWGLDRIFSNRLAFTFDPATCQIGSSFSPSPDDGRKLAVSFKDETMSTWEPIPSQMINFVPYAIQSMNIGGYAADNLLRFAESDGTLVNTTPLNNTQYTALLALVNGTSTAFERAGRLGGVALPTLGAGQAGQMLSWTGTAWTTANSSVGVDSVASNNIVDGSITGADLATNIAITTSSNIVTSGTMSSGNVGIGTTAPLSPLHVFGATNSLAGRISFPSVNVGDWTGIGLGNPDASKTALLFEKTSGGGRGSLHFATSDNASGTYNANLSDARMTITAGGRVGIGTTLPTEALQVVGTIRTSRLKVNGGTPTVAADTGAGTGAVVTVSGRDAAGAITLNTSGTPVAGGNILSLTFSTPLSNATCTFSPASVHAANHISRVYISMTSTGFTFVNANGALTTAGLYIWNYACAERD